MEWGVICVLIFNLKWMVFFIVFVFSIGNMSGIFRLISDVCVFGLASKVVLLFENIFEWVDSCICIFNLMMIFYCMVGFFIEMSSVFGYVSWFFVENGG